ncbi:hypothetical protein BX659_12070 [Orenia metallireducens]|uniref:Alpha-galactosidase NEW3 domain-containing protein n=1 Tax=Orenia metallireducens TaxID=1413210 RepID=A0A285GZE8_9FIRM|nr:hypothetical protein [Orenia metallireducens]PRX26479.1 hypothetical protein BX659_12070 [Orenia metallireducens]SNY28892.1 hypothetical protein SAMN06265827_11270 [Orenia metallireducens]
MENKFILIISIMFILANMISIVSAQESPLLIEVLTPSIESLPGEPVTLLFRLTNIGEEELSFLPQVELPDRWELLVPIESVEIAPKDSKVILLSIKTPTELRAGDYSIPVFLKGKNQVQFSKFEFRVSVPIVKELKVIPLNAPQYTLAQPYTAKFLVQNTGNTPQDINLTLKENLDIFSRIEPNSVYLDAGDSIIIRVKADVPKDITESAIHRLQLIAQNKEDAKVKDIAKVSVEIISIIYSKEELYHTLPVEMTFSNEDTFDSNQMELRLKGSGQLSDRDSGKLSLDINKKSQSIKYTHPDFFIAVGHQNFYLSPLTEDGDNGFGIDFKTMNRRWKWNLNRYKNSDGDNRLGASLAYQLNQDSNLSLQLLTQPELGDLLSLRSNLSPTKNFGVDLEHGRQIESSAEDSSSASRLKASLSNEFLYTNLKWERKDIGYRGIDSNRRKVNLHGEIYFFNPLRLNLNFIDYIKYKEKDTTIYHDRNFNIALTKSLEKNYWNFKYNYSDSLDLEELERIDQYGQSIYLTNKRYLSKERWLYQRIGAKKSFDRRNNERDILALYDLNYHIPYREDSLERYLEIAVPLNSNSKKELGFGFRRAYKINDYLKLYLKMKVEDIFSERYLVSGEWEYKSLNKWKLTVESRVRWSPKLDKSDFKINVAYKIPFNLRLGHRSDIGQLSGCFLDESGNGISDILVHLDGLTVLTESDGYFEFPVVATGVHYLTVQSDKLGANDLIIPRIPWKVKIDSGQKIEQNFRVMKGASLKGRLKMIKATESTLEAGGVFGQGSEKDDMNFVKDIMIELVNEKQSYRYITDKEGRFHFDYLVPGEWTLRVYRNGLPKSYKIEPQQRKVRLESAENRTIEIKIIANLRPINMIEGKILEVESD